MVNVTSPDAQSFRAYLALPPNQHGAGIVLIQEIYGINKTMRDLADRLALKGYVVICPDLFWRQEREVELSEHSEPEQKRAFELYEGLDEAKAVDDAAAAMSFLRGHASCTGKVGVVGYCLGGKLAYLMATRHNPDAAVGYYGVGIEGALDEAGKRTCPLMLHFAERDDYCDSAARAQIEKSLAGSGGAFCHVYEGCQHAFAREGGAHHNVASAELADLRTLGFLHDHLTVAPAEDTRDTKARFAELWAEHIKYEFETRDYEDTLETMVEDAYVNHIPTLTGGVGKKQLAAFYSKRFIPQMPPDTEMTPVSRTIGDDRLVDEMIFKFTHTIEMDWMLPGVAPTGKRVEVALVAIVHFRDDKLAHEHIYWDQASVLVQLGLLDPSDLPVMGVDTAHKVLDNSIPSNALIDRADRKKRSG